MNAARIAQNRWLETLARLFHPYLWLVMAGLFAQGSGSFALGLSPALAALVPAPLATLMNGNPPHAILHIAWGITGLFILAVFRTDRAYSLLGWVFGTFYTLLGFLGMLVYHPFGMRLELPENAFHLTVGPLMLLLAFLDWRSSAQKISASREARL